MYIDKRHEIKPNSFFCKFLFRNNYRRIFISLILILVTIRFSTQLVGLQQNAFSSFVIGLCSDHLGKIIQLKIFKFKPATKIIQKNRCINPFKWFFQELKPSLSFLIMIRIENVIDYD